MPSSPLCCASSSLPAGLRRVRFPGFPPPPALRRVRFAAFARPRADVAARLGADIGARLRERREADPAHDGGKVER